MCDFHEWGPLVNLYKMHKNLESFIQCTSKSFACNNQFWIWNFSVFGLWSSWPGKTFKWSQNSILKSPCQSVANQTRIVQRDCHVVCTMEILSDNVKKSARANVKRILTVWREPIVAKDSVCHHLKMTVSHNFLSEVTVILKSYLFAQVASRSSVL